MNTSTGNQERIGPTPNDFIVPVAIAWEYGARLSYTAPFNLKLEAMYTKTFRTSTELASENRLDARLILFNAAVTMRYAEYLPDVDGFLPAFDADARSAKAPPDPCAEPEAAGRQGVSRGGHRARSALIDGTMARCLDVGWS